ncbi:low affinity sulfate transporter 3 [Tripterygium wilfordii]|uniref:Low affinity sulfate transporter 3 n=1 Tax=Tripterygium wilfordii TaxID=458696 RepID=A0A7J7DUL8_TRIWF|nr:sulfate transporter 2.1 [Tripterygium wilfordii]KAF5749826.1 low affinity sulfate transporter 3 [Tripterygium wilfordii]
MDSFAVETSEAQQTLDLEKNGHVERTQWVLNAPEPPSFWREVLDSVKKTIKPPGNTSEILKRQPGSKRVVLFLQAIFPILSWGRNYKVTKFKNDLMAGLTLASLCIPQSIGYATLAKLDPQYGLYTSVVPPLIYAVMGTSREIAVGPVAVVSLLVSSMIQRLEDPETNPTAYRKLVLTATFFAGIFQAAFGLFRLGFLVDFLSHAALVGFIAGAAIIIGLQQLKGLLGVTHFTNKTDVVSVLKAVLRSVDHSWSPHNFILGCAFLSFILTTRFVGKRNRKLFWLPAIAPLISVILSTLIVFLTRADKHGVKIVKRIKGGLNPSSVHELHFNGPYIGEIAKIGLVIAVVALTEAIAVGRSFASVKGYHLDGNKEMLAMGFTNIIGSLTSCYAATGSFSRTAVNFSAGCETAVSNIVMAITVLISLELFTKLLFFTPTAILASIILSALPGLIDVHEAYRIWKVDKLDFLACLGAFVGVLFVSVEIGLLIAITISFLKIILNSLQPGTEVLGRLPGTEILFDVDQYPMAAETLGVLAVRVKSALLCFANANFVTERILRRVSEERKDAKGSTSTAKKVDLVILDLSNLVNIDTSGIASLEELHKNLVSNGMEIAFTNPRWQVIHKLRLANFVGKVGGGRIFLTVAEALDACIGGRRAAI